MSKQITKEICEKSTTTETKLNLYSALKFVINTCLGREIVNNFLFNLNMKNLNKCTANKYFKSMKEFQEKDK